MVAGVVVLGFVLYDYCSLKHNMPSVRSLAREVASQRAQIRTYAQKVRALNAEMQDLHDFEKKLRVIANVEAPAGQDAIFGIGGTSDEDLEELPPLTEDYSRVIRAIHARLEQLDEAAVVQQKSFGELRDYLQDQKSLLASTPSIRPTTGWISSGFGYRTSPFTGRREFHRGLDIATREGTPVVAPADGVVTFVGRKGGLGNLVVIDHGYGKVTRFGHLKKWLVRRGTHVKRGDKIGLVGNSGRSTAPHLHYEVHVNGLPVNPLKYILN
ncbi:MAG: peptidoglycan DD-metalloendopeptidase family protein [Deltaproteobacteria bacterium]|nr:peptidoglycan DD-metalloendopeptidase family protein [Deltaproteobacteria bacterium]